MASRVLSENLGCGLSRMDESHTKGLGYMADATATLTHAYKEAQRHPLVAMLNKVGSNQKQPRISTETYGVARRRFLVPLRFSFP